MNALLLGKLYGGFFAVDARLLLWVLGLSLAASLGTFMALRRFTDVKSAAPYVALGFVVYLVLSLVVFNLVVGYPVFVIKSFFEIP